MNTKFGVFASRMLPQDEPFVQGHRACQGCAPATVMRLVGKALGRNTIVCNATGCMEIIASPYPFMAWDIPWIHVAFENNSAVASGIEAGMKVLRRKKRYFTEEGEKTAIIAIGGDGGTMDIGLQALSGALERGHDFIYLCYDNEAYMNTGIQRSSGTPYGAATTTSPAGVVHPGQETNKKDFAEICAAHAVPYVATANVAYPLDFVEKLKKAKAVNGPAVIHVFAPCPTGWRCPPSASIKLSRLATETGIFPLYEVENGKYSLSLDIERLRPVTEFAAIRNIRDYLFDESTGGRDKQGRYRHLTEEMIERIQAEALRKYERLKARVKATQELDG
jgi:pyruvate ferredoxin oxidoreductase beta subunit